MMKYITEKKSIIIVLGLYNIWILVINMLFQNFSLKDMIQMCLERIYQKLHPNETEFLEKTNFLEPWVHV